MTALQLFGWQKLDIGTFLKADYSIMVSCGLVSGWPTVIAGCYPPRRSLWGLAGDWHHCIRPPGAPAMAAAQPNL